MKNKIFTITCMLMISLVICDQSFGQSFSLGGGMIYGDDIGTVGAQARAYYNTKNGKMCFGPEFSHFLKSSETIHGEEITRQLNEINFNLHYIMELDEKWGVYPVIGMNMSFEKEEITTLGESHTENINELGANLGAGIHRSFNQWLLFAEYDHLFSDLSQNSIVIGAFFTFGKTTESTEIE